MNSIKRKYRMLNFINQIKIINASFLVKHLFPALTVLLASTQIEAQPITWQHLSSATGDLPLPGKSTQQTAAVAYDFDKDGISDFILGFRVQAPALVWYRKSKEGWERYVIDTSFLTIEAGGAVYDIDHDGDADIVLGSDWQNNKVWWWENPYPNYNPAVPWKRHIIKNTGKTQHHDQAWGDFMQTGTSQLAFWNQGSKTLFLAIIPSHPTNGPWAMDTVFQGAVGESHSWYAEGVAAADIDGDGYTDLLAGNYWFKYQGNGKFKPIHFTDAGGRIATGKFKPGKTMQIVISPGDGTGYLKWYECTGNPEDSAAWIGHTLIDTPLIHCHTLAVADINGDGNLDIFAAEMAKWSEQEPQPDNPKAQAFIFYGDGKGHFTKTIFASGIGFHEGRVADLDGDGDMDILDKPYNWKVPRVDMWLQNGTGKLLPSLTTITQHHIGLEIYSLRREMNKNITGTLHHIHEMGFNEVEVPGLYGLSALQFRKALDSAGLKATSVLYDYDQLKNHLEEVINDAKQLGVQYVGCTNIPHSNIFTLEDAVNGAAFFNKVGAQLKAHHLHFMYHTHGYEFIPSGDSTLFDVLAKIMRPGIADFEMDAFWVFHAGQDPALLLKKYPGRFLALHLKDMKEGNPTGIYSGQTSEAMSVAIGKGIIDFTAILKAAMQTGVKKYYIEDEALDAILQIPLSLKSLQSMQ